jgi:hypothetical protein
MWCTGWIVNRAAMVGSPLGLVRMPCSCLGLHRPSSRLPQRSVSALTVERAATLEYWDRGLTAATKPLSEELLWTLKT